MRDITMAASAQADVSEDTGMTDAYKNAHRTLQ